MSSQTDLIPISGCENPNRVGNIIFVHGLGGDPIKTWQAQGKRNKNNFWPTWLGEDLAEVGVWSLKYKAEPFKWRGSTMSLVNRATNVLHTLDSYEIGKRPLVFITHSMGGLLVKQILQNARDLDDRGWKAIAEQTKGIVFFSTPHSGSDIASWIKYFKLLLPSRSIYELQANNPQLLHLNNSYRSYCQQRKIEMLVYCENLPTSGFIVVDQASANPGITGVNPIPLDKDHIAICRLNSKEDPVYRKINKFVNNLLQAWSKPDVYIESNGGNNSIETNKSTKINNINNNYQQNYYITNKINKSSVFYHKADNTLLGFGILSIFSFAIGILFLSFNYLDRLITDISSNSKDPVSGIEHLNINSIFTANAVQSNIYIKTNNWGKLVILESNPFIIHNHYQIRENSFFANTQLWSNRELAVSSYLPIYQSQHPIYLLSLNRTQYNNFNLLSFYHINTPNRTSNSVTDNMGVLMKNTLSKGRIINDVSLILGNFPNRYIQQLGFKPEELMVLDYFSKMSNSNDIFSTSPIESNIPINPTIDNLLALPGEETIKNIHEMKYIDQGLQPMIIKDLNLPDLDDNCCITSDTKNSDQEPKYQEENIDYMKPVKTPETSNVLSLFLLSPLIFTIKKNQK